MNFKELRNLDRDDILEMIGLQRKTSTAGWLAGTLGTFGIGLLVGAGIALMMAPKSGRELRENLRDRLRRMPEDMSDTMAGVGRDPLGSANKAY
jgi:gas vesicle protein